MYCIFNVRALNCGSTAQKKKLKYGKDLIAFVKTALKPYKVFSESLGQGWSLSCLLFNLVLDPLLKEKSNSSNFYSFFRSYKSLLTNTEGPLACRSISGSALSSVSRYRTQPSRTHRSGVRRWYQNTSIWGCFLRRYEKRG